MTHLDTRTRPLRLLIAFDSIQRGGAEEYALSLARGIAARGVEVHATFPVVAGTATLANDFRDAGIAVHPGMFGRAAAVFNRRPRPLPKIIECLSMRRVLRAVRPDVAHISLAGQAAALGIRAACAQARVPATAILHVRPRNPIAASGARLAFERYCARTQRWLSVSEIGGKALCQGLGISGTAVTVIHNGIVLERFEQVPKAAARKNIREALGLPEEAVVLLTVARLAPQKAHGAVLEAAPALVQECPDLHFVWLGAGELRGDLEAKASALGVGDRVHFPGWRDDTPDWYAGADLFLFPTHYEGFPYAVLEAAASGLPQLVSDEPGVREFADDATALIVPANTPEAWAAAIRAALADSAGMRRRADAARTKVSAFSLDAMISETLACIEHVKPATIRR